MLADFDPCLILLNNDLSAGRPGILEDLEQPIAPPWRPGGHSAARPPTLCTTPR